MPRQNSPLDHRSLSLFLAHTLRSCRCVVVWDCVYPFIVVLDRDVFPDAMVEAKTKARGLRGRGQGQGQIISDQGHVHL